MIRMFLMAALVMAISGAAYAQENDGTTAAHQAAGTKKSLRDMSPEERRAFWNHLPEADKQRILERRQKIQAERLKKEDWKDLSEEERAARLNRDQYYPGQSSNKSVKVPPTRAEKQRYEELSAKRQKAAKEQWEAMTPDEKALFLKTHSAEIRDAVNTRAGR